MAQSSNKTTATQDLAQYLTDFNANICSNSTDQANCIAKKDDLTTIQEKIINERNEFYNIANDTTRDTTHNLADKETTVKIFEKETQNLQDHISNIKQERMNKQRLVEASEWEYDR